MNIKRFEFSDLRSDWHLEEATLDPFNLLVGVSGVGKTKILDSLRHICSMATEGEYSPGLVRWAIEFEHGGQTYRWKGSTEAAQDDAFSGEETSPELPAGLDVATQIARETIESGEETLVERDQKGFRFKENPLPRLTKSASAISLLKEEGSIARIREGFRRFLFSSATSARPYRVPPSWTTDIDARLHRYRQLGADRDGFDAFREMLALAGLSKVSQYAPLSAYYLQEAFPEQFEDLKALFTGIFASVEELKVLTASEPRTSLIRHELAIRERGCNGWIGQAEMSSGMLRTLVHLLELTLAPRGSIIVIDEFENSLGVNCMPQLTDFILSREQDLQFIITSHHPYVINNIPPATWKLVTRTGGSVRVVAAKDIPSLQNVSHQKAFIRLINLPEFEEGIS